MALTKFIHFIIKKLILTFKKLINVDEMMINVD